MQPDVFRPALRAVDVQSPPEIPGLVATIGSAEHALSDAIDTVAKLAEQLDPILRPAPPVDVAKLMPRSTQTPSSATEQAQRLCGKIWDLKHTLTMIRERVNL